MREYIEILKRHVEENPPNYVSDANSILEIQVASQEFLVNQVFSIVPNATSSSTIKIRFFISMKLS
mgnify:CR=1 FL=1